MADLGRLKHEIAGLHDERLPLVLIDDAHPPSSHDDQLQRDAVVMHPVGDRAAVRDRNVRGDVTTAETAGHEIAIDHSRAPLPAITSGVRQDEAGPERRNFGQQGRSGPRRHAQDFVAAAQEGGSRIVRREDRIEPEPGAAQLVERSVQVRADPLDFVQAFLAGFLAAGFLAVDFAPAFGAAAFTGLASTLGASAFAGLASAFATGFLTGALALASGAFAAGPSFSGFVGLGLAGAFSTAPLAGCSGCGLASDLGFAVFFALAGLAGAR